MVEALEHGAGVFEQAGGEAGVVVDLEGDGGGEGLVGRAQGGESGDDRVAGVDFEVLFP